MRFIIISYDLDEDYFSIFLFSADKFCIGGLGNQSERFEHRTFSYVLVSVVIALGWDCDGVLLGGYGWWVEACGSLVWYTTYLPLHQYARMRIQQRRVRDLPGNTVGIVVGANELPQALDYDISNLIDGVRFTRKSKAKRLP
ncbi:hypothetical protein Tco_1430281 [Tanacetum coccineum]